VLNKVVVSLKKEQEEEFTVVDVKLPETQVNEKMKSLLSIPKQDVIWSSFRFSNYTVE
jgi:hypothetical protein